MLKHFVSLRAARCLDLKGRFIMTNKNEIKNAIKAVWSNASKERKQEALIVEHTILGYEANEDKVIADLTSYFTDCVKCDVVDGVIVIDCDDPAYNDLGPFILNIDQLINCLG